MRSFHGMRLRDSVTADALRAMDWAATSLGPPQLWSSSFKTAVQLCLNSAFPITLAWGRDLLTIYNDGYLPIMGSKHPHAFGRPVLEVYAELHDFLAPRLTAIVERGEIFVGDDALLTLETGGPPSEAYFTFCYSPVRDDAGDVQGVMAVASDTTQKVLQRRRTATVLALTEALAQHTWQQPVGPLISRSLRGNPEDFERFALFSAGGEGALQSLSSHPDDFAASLQASGALDRALSVARQARQGVSMTQTGERCHVLGLADDQVLEGQVFLMAVEPAALVAADDAYRDFLRIAADAVVSAVYRIFAEQRVYASVRRRLDQRERLYRLLFEHSRDGILICDSVGAFLMANPAACRMLGYDEPTLLATPRSEVIADHVALTNALTRSASSGAFTGVLRHRRQDGSEFPADVSAVAFTDEDTGDARSILLIRDATDRLQAQARITATARLEAVGQLTGGISHDFNNLLNVIIQGAEHLQELSAGDVDARESADLVLKASLQAAALTRQLLAFSRQQPLQRRTVDLADTVDAVAQILMRGLGEAVDVTIDVAPKTLVHVDPALLQSAVLNLAINARDAMPQGGTLTIRSDRVWLDADAAAELELASAAYLAVHVSDTGVGIPPEHVSRVIEPFFTTKAPGQGTGLGLSMVFGFARQSGGGLHVRSQPGAGTTVTLFLPEPLVDAAAEAEPGTDAAAVRHTTGRHLLVVEDNDLLASMLTRILEGAGHRVTLCSSAESALAVLDDGGPVDLVITDIVLGPGMDGWSLADAVRQRRPEVPVATMSGYAPADGRASARPALPVLQKPFRPRQILALIDELLGTSGP